MPKSKRIRNRGRIKQTLALEPVQKTKLEKVKTVARHAKAWVVRSYRKAKRVVRSSVRRSVATVRNVARASWNKLGSALSAGL